MAIDSTGVDCTMTHEEIWSIIYGEIGDAILIHKDFPWGGVVVWKLSPEHSCAVDVYTDVLVRDFASRNRDGFTGLSFTETHGGLIYSRNSKSIEDAVSVAMGLITALSSAGTNQIADIPVLGLSPSKLM